MKILTLENKCFLLNNLPEELTDDVRFAVLWWNTEQEFEPHYYIHEIAKNSTNTWIVFAWEEWWNPQNGYK